MKEIKIYTTNFCPFCVRAKNLLKRKNIAFEEINLDGKDEELQALRNRTEHRTVPQIFIGDEFIGGFSELSNLEAEGKLESKIL